MTKVERIATGTSSSVQKERFSGLIQIQELFQISMREKDSSLQPRMGRLLGEFFQTFNQFFVDLTRSKLFNQFIVIHCALYIPGSHSESFIVVISFRVNRSLCHLWSLQKQKEKKKNFLGNFSVDFI